MFCLIYYLRMLELCFISIETLYILNKIKFKFEKKKSINGKSDVNFIK